MKYRARRLFAIAGLVCAFFCAALFGIAHAQEISAQNGQVLLNRSDIATLQKAVDFIERSPELLADVWHYAGPDHSQNQFVAAEELAVMDAGLAGPKWKAAYDYAAGLDAKLPGSAADPYRARHALTAQIQKACDSYK